MFAHYYRFMHLGNQSLISFWLHHQLQSTQPNDEEMDDLLFRLLITRLGEEFVQGLFRLESLTTHPLPLSQSLATENLPQLIDVGRQLLERKRLYETIQQLHSLDKEEDHHGTKKNDKDLLTEAYLCLADLLEQLQQEPIYDGSLFAEGSQLYARLLGGKSLERGVHSYIRERQYECSRDLGLGL